MGKGDRNRSLGNKNWNVGADKLWGGKCRFNHKHTKECLEEDNRGKQNEEVKN